MASPLVLIVDDEPSFLEVASLMLSKAGYAVAPASNAQEALEIVRNTEIDMIISDVVMPGIQGPELLEIVEQAAPETALMLMSAAPMAPATKFAFLRKPFHSSELTLAVERTLGATKRLGKNLARAVTRGTQRQTESQRVIRETKEAEAAGAGEMIESLRKKAVG